MIGSMGLSRESFQPRGAWLLVISRPSDARVVPGNPAPAAKRFETTIRFHCTQLGRYGAPYASKLLISLLAGPA
jgi:hypothetical protein